MSVQDWVTVKHTRRPAWETALDAERATWGVYQQPFQTLWSSNSNSISNYVSKNKQIIHISQKDNWKLDK